MQQFGWQLVPIASLAVAIAALYFAREVFIPVALSILLSFFLAPPARRLEQLGLGRTPAALVTVLLALALLASVGWVMAGQIVDLVEKIPSYQQNIEKKVTTLRRSSEKVMQETSRTVRTFQSEVAQTTQPTSGASRTAPTRAPAPVTSPTLPLLGSSPPNHSSRPIPVEVVSRRSTILQNLRVYLGPVVSPLSKTLLVLVFTVFMLIQRDDLRDRLVQLFGRGQLPLTTQAIDEASRRISRYLLMQFIVNVTYGAPIGIGLYLIGIPNAFLWGIMATLLRFIPFLGPWLAASLPILLSFAVFEGWTRPLLTIGLYLCVELISNNAIEPWLYGSSTGISPVALIMAAVFWTWLWGTVGLFLSTPMTVCLVVIGRYVPQFGILNILLGDEPVLSPETRFYQRLLAMDDVEVTRLTEEFLAKGTLEQYYDEILLPALRLAEQDRHRGLVDHTRQQFIEQTVEELIQNAAEITPFSKEAASTEASHGAKAPAAASRVMIIPATDKADELAGRMAAQLLERHGSPTEVLSAELLSGEMREQVETQKPQIVCISALPPFATARANLFLKRLNKRFPEVKLLLGFWQAPQPAKPQGIAIAPDSIATTLSELLSLVRKQK